MMEKTGQRKLPSTTERNWVTRPLLYGLAGMLVVIGSAGVGRGAQPTAAVSPQQLAARVGNATVYIQEKWRLYDRAGKALYQKTVSLDGKSLPAYVSMDGHVYRWLTTEDEFHTNLPVGGVGYGAGFVVSGNGLIVANKHIAAGWKTNYAVSPSDERGQGVVFTAQPKMWNDNDSREHAEHIKWLGDHSPKVVDLGSHDFRAALSWQPEAGGPVFANGQPTLVGDAMTAFEGRNEELSVRFPGSQATLEARLLRMSNDADMALIKIDPPQQLVAVSLPQNDQVAVGEPVTVLGYPETAGSMPNDKALPEPTVTTGIISNIGHQTTGEATIGAPGDVYQIIVSTASANSGSPVFDEKGDAIGLFTQVSGADATVTYAVPIRYARELMGL